MSEREISSGDSQQSLRQGGTAEGADWVRVLSELEAKACESPWRVDHDSRPEMEWNNHIVYGDGNAVCFMAHSGNDDNEEHEAAAEFICALRNAWPQIKAALSAAPRPDAGEGLVQRYKWLLEHAQSGGFMPRAVNEVRIDVTVLEGQRLSLKRLTGKELDSFIVAALEAARALGRGEAGEGGK